MSGERSLGVTGGVVGHVEIAVPWDLANENITVNVSDVDLHLGHVSGGPALPFSLLFL